MDLTWKLLLAAGVLSAQARFEVASIKPDAPGGVSTGNLQLLAGGRLSAQKVLLQFFIQNAYELKPYQIVGAPDWINSEGYDIEAKAEGDASPDQMRQMMRALLAERFQMTAHRETREMPVYALTEAKGGFKAPGPNELSCAEPGPDSPPASDEIGPCGRARVTIGRMGSAQIKGGKISMAELARVLSNLMGRTVLERTGVDGEFDVHLQFGLDDAIFGIPRPPGVAAENGPPSIFVAVQEQLGLKLESTKGPVEVLVIDHVERPSGNE